MVKRRRQHSVVYKFRIGYILPEAACFSQDAQHFRFNGGVLETRRDLLRPHTPR